MKVNHKKKLYSTFYRLCKQKYNKYGEWIDDTFIPYDDMEEVV